MSRYRKIETRTWADEKFMRLTPMQPSGQCLWFYLLTGPHTGPVPGLFRAGRAAMADDLDWPLEAFDAAFEELLREGMVRADFKAKLVWLPNAIKYNKPESPNVVKSWGRNWMACRSAPSKVRRSKHSGSTCRASRMLIWMPSTRCFLMRKWRTVFIAWNLPGSLPPRRPRRLARNLP